MNPSNIRTEIEKRVMRVTIDRPKSLNALNSKTLTELQAALDHASKDDEVRTVVLTGAGDKAFVAGADIAEIRMSDENSVGTLVKSAHELMQCIQNLGKPVIAAVNGFALGGGCELALACTLRIASDNAMIGLPEIKLGLLPGFGGTQRMTQVAGVGRALEMMLSGNPISADKALAWGIFNQVVRQDQLYATVDDLAFKLANSAPLAMRSILSVVHGGLDLPLEDGLKLEAKEFVKTCQTRDMQEGTAAFLEKREAKFNGT